MDSAEVTTTNKTVIPYKPLEWTRSSSYDNRTGGFLKEGPGFHQSDARFRIVCGGRRLGKGEAGAPEIFKAAVTRPGSVNWWVAPIYKQARVGWKKLIPLIPEWQIEDLSKTHMFIKLKNGSEIEFRSAEHEEYLRSEGLDFVVCDELAMWKESSFESAIWPALADKAGKMVGLSTPKARNFFFRYWSRGQDREYKTWASWKFPTHANTTLGLQAIEELTSGMNELVYNQEILAEFIADAGGVFRNVRNNVRGYLPYASPKPGRTYMIGVDWGKRRDFSVFIVLDVTETPRKIVAYDRLSKVDYTLQLERLKNMIKIWSPSKVKAEQNSMGDALIDSLRRDLPGVFVEGIFVAGGRDGGNKNRMIEKLAMCIENGEIEYPDWPELLAELELYEYKSTGRGNVTYSAPSGYHDDCVMALALGDEEGSYVEPAIHFAG